MFSHILTCVKIELFVLHEEHELKYGIEETIKEKLLALNVYI